MSDSRISIWEKLGSPQYVVAPMVDSSELAWRLLCRKYCAQLCYTPMIHSQTFVNDSRYRIQHLESNDEDRPLIAQFCGNNAEVLLKAAQLAESQCDGIDINLGCPQVIARRGHYGAFLQDEWSLLATIVKTLRENINIPVSCKIRIFPEIKKSIEYARMLEDAGCQMLTVHGRTREQKGPMTGVASWQHIKAIKDAVKIPIIANGNIQCLTDVTRCLDETGCDAVMSAEGVLCNPALFAGQSPPVWQIAFEYLSLVEDHPCPWSYVRGHLFKLFRHVFSEVGNEKIREVVATSLSIHDFRKAVEMIQEKYGAFHLGQKMWISNGDDYNVNLPPWICQSWVRLPPEDYVKKMEIHRLLDKEKEIERNNCETNAISKRQLKKLKKMERKPKRSACVELIRVVCSNCTNPLGLKCEYKLCRLCCARKCDTNKLDCAGHRNKKRKKLSENNTLG